MDVNQQWKVSDLGSYLVSQRFAFSGYPMSNVSSL
jgi:hypothetical protein